MIAVTITDRGRPVVPVEANAPAAILVESGGQPITIATIGEPMIIAGYVAPE